MFFVKNCEENHLRAKGPCKFQLKISCGKIDLQKNGKYDFFETFMNPVWQFDLKIGLILLTMRCSVRFWERFQITVLLCKKRPFHSEHSTHAYYVDMSPFHERNGIPRRGLLMKGRRRGGEFNKDSPFSKMSKIGSELTILWPTGQKAPEIEKSVSGAFCPLEISIFALISKYSHKAVSK